MVVLRVMTASDLAVGMRLKEAAGWNQTEADWRRALDLEPEGCFVAEQDGTPAGTVTTCIFERVAWIAMMLVEPAHRGQGIGRALMQHALEFLDDRQIQTVRLDATPMGQPLYEKLGFRAEYTLNRHEGILPPSEFVAQVGKAHDVESLLRLDREITATDRRKLLLRLFSERPEAVRVVRDAGEGFLTARPGARALHLGPCIATGAAGSLLFRDACHRLAGQRVFVDIPEAHAAATNLARAWGLTVQRPLVRMSRGQPVHERLDGLWASSGPEKG